MGLKEALMSGITIENTGPGYLFIGNRAGDGKTIHFRVLKYYKIQDVFINEYGEEVLNVINTGKR